MNINNNHSPSDLSNPSDSNLSSNNPSVGSSTRDYRNNNDEETVEIEEVNILQGQEEEIEGEERESVSNVNESYALEEEEEEKEVSESNINTYDSPENPSDSSDMLSCHRHHQYH